MSRHADGELEHLVRHRREIGFGDVGGALRDGATQFLLVRSLQLDYAVGTELTLDLPEQPDNNGAAVTLERFPDPAVLAMHV
jgi:hypothetical protein